MNTKHFFVLLFFMSLTSAIIAQPGSGMPSEPGKCYAKCMIPDQMVTEFQLLPKYTGPPVDTLLNPNVIAIKFIPEPATSRWEKRRADKNCLSSDPDVCLVWCKIEVPEIRSIEYFVKDTLLTPSFEWQSFPVRKVNRKGGYTEWKEVLCDSDVTPKIINKVKKALNEIGIYSGELDGYFDKTAQNALLTFQRNEGLAIGSLSKETLKALKVLK